MEEQDQDEIYASELKETLLRLRPDFNEKAYGCATFYKLLTKLANRFGDLRVHNDNFNVMVGLTNAGDNGEVIPQLTRENWKEAFAAQIRAYKEGGFDRVNPSILKADIRPVSVRFFPCGAEYVPVFFPFRPFHSFPRMV